MVYKVSKITGKWYDENNNEISLDTNTQQGVDVDNWLKLGKEPELFEGTPEEIAEASKPIVPDSISQMKLRKQLILSGISIDSIDALIQSLPQPNRDLIYTMWEYAVVFDRHNPELNAMAQMLEITQQQLDEIFINGNLL